MSINVILIKSFCYINIYYYILSLIDCKDNVVGSLHFNVSIVSILLIGISAFLTGLNIFNKIGKFAGAGSLVPITGFANSIVSPAMEYKSEGYVMGVGGKMFTVAGPVLVFGISASVIIGILATLFNGI